MQVKKNNWFKIEFTKEVPIDALCEINDVALLIKMNECIARYRKTLNQNAIACAKKSGDAYIVHFPGGIHIGNPILKIYMDKSFVTTDISLSNSYSDSNYMGGKSQKELDDMLDKYEGY